MPKFTFTLNSVLRLAAWIALLSPWSATGLYAGLSNLTVSPASGSGRSQVFTFQATDSSGFSNITALSADIVSGDPLHAQPSSWNACFVYYQRSTNLLFLSDDYGNFPLPANAPHVGDNTPSVVNNRCSIDPHLSNVSGSGNTLTLNLQITFTTYFYGTDTVFLQATNPSGGTEWLQAGSWVVTDQAPSVLSVTPSIGTGPPQTWQTFTFDSQDLDGYADIVSVSVDITGGVPTNLGACFIYYRRATNEIYLADDNGNWPDAKNLGAAGTPLFNNQCMLDYQNSSASVSGNYDVVLNLRLSFTDAFAGMKNIYMQASDGVFENPWDAGLRGNWAVSQTPTVQLTVTGEQSGTTYKAGDSFTVTITGPPNQPVSVNQNGGGISATGGYTNAQGVWTITGVWAMGDVGDYTQSWYVGGVAAVPGLSFQVSSTGATLSCGGGFDGLNDFAPNAQFPIRFNASGASSVVFNIAGANTNPFTRSVTATRVPGSATYIGTLNTTGLLGAYSITAVITAPNASRVSCNKDFFSVFTPTPLNGGQADCASMSGTWKDSINGETGSWNLTDNNGTITGNETVNFCGTVVNWNVSGSYVASSQSLTLNAVNGSPSTFNCQGDLLTSFNHSFTSSGNAFSRPSCARATGLTFRSQTSSQSGQTLTASERIPEGETSSFSSWADAYGAPTTAIFNMTLNVVPGGPSYNFGGRAVTQYDPSPSELPSGFNPNDGCYWSRAPWREPFTSLATPGSTWYVQSSGQNGSYGRDYVGLGTTIVGWIQNYAPAITATGSCRIQYPQKMMINKETVAGGTEPYGGPQSGFNLLVFTFTPTSISVARGSGTGMRTFYF